LRYVSRKKVFMVNRWLICGFLTGLVLAASTSADDRQATEARSLASTANSAADRALRRTIEWFDRYL
jgi:hypothetical protein